MKWWKNAIKSQKDFSASSIMLFVLGWDTLLCWVILLCEYIVLLGHCWVSAVPQQSLVEAGVPGQGQFFCPVWVLIYSIFWQCGHSIPGRSREHLQLSTKACSILSCRYSTADGLNRLDQAGWRETRDDLWMQVNEQEISQCWLEK